jgi:unsaturated chondroitin disaccharide hydrolase
MTTTGSDWAEAVWPKIEAKMAAQTERLGAGAKIPYLCTDGRYDDKASDNIYWWTNGFWAGCLWLAYRRAKPALAARFQAAARAVEERLDTALSGFEGLHHDVGFMWTLCSRLDYVLTGNAAARTRALHAASLLAGRYNPRGRFIRAWNGDFTGRIIIDCMMNLPLLYWASSETKDPRFSFIAMDHADTALKYLLRPDGSCNHIASLDPATGGLIDIPDGQGFSPESSWSRGQAWALYGFALSALHTGEARYLAAAEKTALYFVTEAERAGFVTPSDFRAPKEPEKLDLSAGVIGACGLLQLARLVCPEKAAPYKETALRLLETTEARFCDWDAARDGIVQKCTAQYHGKSEQFHVPLIYGDYFFIEAVTKLLSPEFQVW